MNIKSMVITWSWCQLIGHCTLFTNGSTLSVLKDTVILSVIPDTKLILECPIRSLESFVPQILEVTGKASKVLR